MKRSHILKQIGSNSPCLLCDQAVSELGKNGKRDLAFSIPQVAFALWESHALSSEEQLQLNEQLARLIRCSTTEEKHARNVSSIRQTLVEIEDRDDRLAQTIVEFLSAFDEKNV
jgi:hypothetical protein